jgi:glycosyltransferase involved in cell wall biosynthesis
MPNAKIVNTNLRSLRVLVVCYELPPVGGGGGRIALDVARGLVRRGHKVRILTSHVSGLAREEMIDGVSVRRAFAFRRRRDRCSIPEMVGYVMAQAGPAMNEIEGFQPDIVHAHFAVPSGAVAWAATRLRSVPYLVTAHLGDVPGGAPEQTEALFRVVKPLTVPIWHAAAGATAVSEFVVRCAERAYGVRAVLIRNGIPMRNSAIGDPSPPGEMLRLVWAGRMQKQKNLASGLEGLAQLTDRPWSLDIAGDGPLRAETEAKCQELGLGNHVRFHGWVDADTAFRLMREADVMFLPSLSEGLSLATLEGLRAGLGFLASGIPGVEDVIEDGVNGILCNPRVPAEFAVGLRRMLETPGMVVRMRTESIRRAALFDSERMIDGYEVELMRVAASTRNVR